MVRCNADLPEERFLLRIGINVGEIILDENDIFGDGVNIAARDKCTKASRELLRVYVLVLANSDIRTGEANKLKVTDVHSFRDDKQRNNYRLIVRGKTGERDAIVR